MNILVTPHVRQKAEKHRNLFKGPEAREYLSRLNNMEVRLGVNESSGNSLERTFELAQKALASDESLAGGHGLLAYIHLMKRQI